MALLRQATAAMLAICQPAFNRDPDRHPIGPPSFVGEPRAWFGSGELSARAVPWFDCRRPLPRPDLSTSGQAGAAGSGPWLRAEKPYILEAALSAGPRLVPIRGPYLQLW